jgi:hypothetical protein
MLRHSMLVAVAFAVPTVVLADAAVESTNGSISGTASKGYDSGDWSDSTLYGLGGNVTMPLGERFGFTLSGGYSMLENDVCDVDAKSAGMQLFARDASLGRIGVSYGQGTSEGCSVSDAFGRTTEEFDSDVYGVNAEYYFGSMTFGATRSRVEYDDGFDADTASLSALWYPDANFSIGVSGGALDAEDNYTLSFRFQPEFFSNSASMSLGWSTNTESDADAVTVGFTYYFGSDVDLMTRDRKYR